MKKYLLLLPFLCLLLIPISAQNKHEEEAVPFQLVERKPSFNGGDENEFARWVNERLVYPEVAKENGVQGKVVIQFKVQADGSVTNVKVLSGIDPAVDAECVRVVSASPKWEPGYQRGKAVPVSYSFPVFFGFGGNNSSSNKGYSTNYSRSGNNNKKGSGDNSLRKPMFMGMPAENFETWANSHIIYPKEAEDQKIEGKVVVEHMIDLDGSVSNVHVSQGVHPLLDAEAVRVVSSSPKWSPAKYNGKPLQIPNTVTVTFQLQKSGTSSDEAIPYQIIDQKPTFNGGDIRSFSKWVNENLVYPEYALNNGIQGRVSVQFIVNENGKVDNLSILKSVHPLLDAEAFRVIASSPAWTPGGNDGHPKKVLITYPVLFKLKPNDNPANTSSPVAKADSMPRQRIDNADEAIPVKLVEEKPSFNGGDASEFSKWINTELQYPKEAKERGVQGRVTLQFRVEADGSVTNVKVLRGVDPALDAEAVRVVSSSPKWKPGKQKDRAVAVTYTFPVIFQLR